MDQDQEFRLETDRLRLLDKQTQRDMVAMYRHLAQNHKLSAKDREQARRRAEALARMLKL
jgi:hypothetical protein